MFITARHTGNWPINMKKPLFKSGDFVQSRYRAPWIGVIQEIAQWSEYGGKEYPIYNVKPVLDRTGRPQPKHVKSQQLAEGWLIKFDNQQTIA